MSAGDWVNHVSPLLKGKGGGKAESAQGSGSNFSALNEAMDAARKFAYSKLGEGSQVVVVGTPSSGKLFIISF